ncbi:1-deoxyxylulose-5-phosphate synthase YajO-like [Liolophura sinensis]|uniref:1-deoxyxylulose-5-phosphate synthase YajO-like n=1 Tax=Liolophura sinensis TaxID=3198878 RepID=UPI00315876D4
MKRVTLPGSDLSVSPVCIGCWQFNDGKDTVNWDAQPQEVSKQVVEKALEVGINFFDTAEGYSGSEEVLGRSLRGRRQDAIIATKYGFREGPSTQPYTAVQVEEAIERSLKKLEMSYIDLLQIHFPSFVADIGETIKELDRQVSLGKIRYYGVSNYGPKNLREFFDAGGKPISNQLCYNLLWRSIENEVLPICREKNMSILAYSPLQQGLLSGRFKNAEDFPEGRRRGKLFGKDSTKLSRHGQDGAEKEVFQALEAIRKVCDRESIPMARAALSWVIQQPSVPVVIVGARTPEQVVENSKVVTLKQEVLDELASVTEDVKKAVGSSLDQWAHPDRCQ